MTTQATDELYQLLRAFSPALKSVDVRTVAVCPPLEAHWENLVTSLVLSNKTVQEVKSEHDKLPPVRNKANNFAIFLSAHPFDYTIFGQINNGELRYPLVSSIQYQIKFREFDPLNLKVNSTQEWVDGSVFHVLKATAQGQVEDRKKLWDIVHQQNNFANSIGFPNVQRMIQHYLKIDYAYNTPKDFEITILPLAKIEHIKFSGRKVIISFQKSPHLNDLQLNFILERNQGKVWIKPCQLKGEENSVEVEMDEVSPLDNLIVNLIHRESGLTLDRTSEKVPLENVSDPLVKTFDAFCPLDKLEKMLLNPEDYGKSPERIFENAVSWLLSLCGFEIIPLGIVIKRLNNKEERFDSLQAKSAKHVGSADIIVYEPNERILLVDCDIDFVDPKKVKKMSDLKKHFRKKLKGYEQLHILPILFTPVDFRKTSPHIDVMIADRSVIKQIFEYVVKGDRERATSLLRYSGL